MPTMLPWRTLIESIKRDDCILLLGPQASFDPGDPDHVPLTIRLAHHLADHAGLAGNNDLVNRNDVAHVAQLFKQQFDRYSLGEAVEGFYAPYQKLTTQFHRDMAALPFSLCINTTPDDFYFNALADEGKAPVRDFYNFKRARALTSIKPTAEQPYIYSLYGHCDDLESLVLAEDDLLEFLVKIIKGSPELPPFIRSQFADADINFLFVGFGFHSWHNRILLHALNAHNHSNQSLAVEDQSFFDHPDRKQTVVFYTRHNKIKFEHLSWLEFARELRNAYTPPVSPKTTIPQQPQENAPKVFLCYASEDREQVEQLSRQLYTAGIDPWQDKQNLRAGDNWDRLLVQVIHKIVDYVIVVQTPAMTGQFEGYFHKEIATALDRQKHFAEGFRFILPIMHSDQKILEQLKDFHAIRLDTQDGFRQLVDAIKTDWQRRRKQA